jgi:hypothetical protein
MTAPLARSSWMADVHDQQVEVATLAQLLRGLGVFGNLDQTVAF